MKIQNSKFKIRRGGAVRMVAFLMALGLTAKGAAADAPMQQNAARQEQIRSEAQLLVTRLDDVLAEYMRNGLAKGEDFEGLKAVRAELGSLSEEEMEQVIVLLRQAAGDPGQMAKAYSGQKDISVRLKQILAQHQRQQDIEALASAVRQLADRQAANLTTAVDAGQLAGQDTSANGQAAVTASEQAQQSEQSAIAEEVKLVAAKLNQVDGDPKYKEAATQLALVPPEAAAAADALGAGKINDALTSERAVHEQLDTVFNLLTPAGKQQPQQNQQNQEAGRLADLARDERALLAKTAPIAAELKAVTDAETPEAAGKAMNDQIKNPNSALAKNLAQSGITLASAPDEISNSPVAKAFLDTRAAALKKQEQAAQSRLAALAADQAALAAKAQIIRDDLQNTAKDAGAPMANALTQMNSAQEALSESDADQATQEEADAAKQLDQAQRLAEQSGAGQSPAATPATPQQQLQQLQAGVNALTNRETASVQQGDAQKTGPMAAAAAALQTSLAAKAQALQQAAANGDSPAAPALQQAADALRQAGQAMQPGGTPAQAAAAQQSALQALGQAAQQLAQQAAAAVQAQQQLANLDKDMAGLARVIQQQQQMAAETEKAIDGAPAALPVKARVLARAQQITQIAEQAVRRAAGTDAPDAAKALDQADPAMGDARQKLSDAAIAQSQPPQKAALDALYKAQDAMASEAQQLAQAAGQPQPGQAQAQAAPGANAANAAMAAIGKAAAQDAAAQAAMAQGQPGAAAAQLAQAARIAGLAEAQPQAMPQAARDAVRNAEQDLGAAAAAAQAGQGQEAQAQAAQAGQALAAAQSAMAQAQAGIADLSPAGSPPSPGSGAPAPGTGPSSPVSGPPSPGAGPPAPGAGPPSAGPGQPATAQGPPQPGQGQGMTSAMEKNWGDQGGAVTAGAQGAHGPAAYIGLPDRDRAAIQQSQTEKYPQEYGSMIEEYMRSLASDAGGK